MFVEYIKTANEVFSLYEDIKNLYEKYKFDLNEKYKDLKNQIISLDEKSDINEKAFINEKIEFIENEIIKVSKEIEENNNKIKIFLMDNYFIYGNVLSPQLINSK